MSHERNGRDRFDMPQQMVGSALLSAYRNAGGDIDLKAALYEMQRRKSSVIFHERHGNLKYKYGKDNLLGGAFIDNAGKSVFAKFEAVGKQTVTTTTIMPVDALTLIVAAVLVSIEKKIYNSATDIYIDKENLYLV